ncbi:MULTISPECIES: IS66 family insertion sequence element accessory protein TnpB [unclassified Thiocapsa]|uniref:IS66 family insertion sequence element accessory protein TnpB n=1 Tax=unclassified Thiocapsa TaxID=2641286 RepID=UPI0035AFEBEB
MLRLTPTAGFLRVAASSNNGFWLWYRRLERERFWWPAPQSVAPVILSIRELGWLLEGLDPRRVNAHRRAEFDLL